MIIIVLLLNDLRPKTYGELFLNSKRKRVKGAGKNDISFNSLPSFSSLFSA